MEKVYIDDRETESTQNVLKGVFENAEVERLRSGDIVRKDLSAAGERKQINDFISSIGDKRLWNQIDTMSQRYEYNCLVVEGSHFNDYVLKYYNGAGACTRQVLGVCAWLNLKPNWSAFWIQEEGNAGTKLLGEYMIRWFKQVQKRREKEGK